MAFVLKNDEQVTATLEFFDRKGKRIASPTLDGVPTWSSSDPDKVSVTPAADGLSALIVAAGDPDDTATITAEADGDLGEGVKPITTTGDVQIIGGDVATSNMNFGADAATLNRSPTRSARRLPAAEFSHARRKRDLP